jgi:hypothetical protein
MPKTDKSRGKLLDSIHKGTKLKKTVTNDRSGPDLSVAKKGPSGGGGPPMGGMPMGMGMPSPGGTNLLTAEIESIVEIVLENVL